MAHRIMFRLAHWTSRVFSLEFDLKSEPLYFALSPKPRSGGNEKLQAFLGALGSGKVFSLYVNGDDRIQRARSYATLKKELFEELPPGCEVTDVASFLPDTDSSVVRGFLLRGGSAQCLSERVLRRLQPDQVCVLSYDRSEDGHYRCGLWRPDAADAEEKRQVYYVIPASPPQRHPSTLNIKNSDVFYRMEDAYRVLQECSDIIPEAQAVLEILDHQVDASRHEGGFPVIVLEGLDATGKTTLTESLQKALGASLLKSPPQCLAPFRQRFDSEPPLIRRAFYALGNYLTAAQIRDESSRAPVIVDRYWHSTAAYAIATAVGGKVENLPPPGSDIYAWPADLLQPSLVVLLAVTPQERLRRLQHRGLEKTEEETQLEINQLFRQKVDESYKRIRNPACVIVDASPAPDQVLLQVLSLIRGKFSL
ncbi:UMP-CMP kinase 2, mitochondrial [Brachyhypopomus gauderio]|uniref:UMP-CMP kinase 2, mitochondrial n=1 Tax=Brachyhypopomus gauderio TaxID=698409 RepID=UPI0040417CCA